MSFVAYTPGSYVLGMILTIVFFLCVAGYLVGSFLADVIKARVMYVGSVVFWVAALLIWLYAYAFYYQQRFYGSVIMGLFWLTPAVLCADVTYVIKYFVKKRRTQS